jgi:hypothetical protein
MPKQRLNEEQYIDKLNERLQQHPDYTPGMQFLPYPEGARGGNIRGIAISELRFNHVFMDANLEVQAEYDLEPTYAGFPREVKG